MLHVALNIPWVMTNAAYGLAILAFLWGGLKLADFLLGGIFKMLGVYADLMALAALRKTLKARVETQQIVIDNLKKLLKEQERILAPRENVVEFNTDQSWKDKVLEAGVASYDRPNAMEPQADRK